MGFSIWQLLIVLAIVLVLFGAKRLRNVGGDLGAAIKGFKEAVNDGKNEQNAADNVYDAKATEQQAITQQNSTAEEKPVNHNQPSQNA